MSRPDVSVIITFLNEERYLPRAVRSVFEQRFTNWELVLVDDGSTDASSQFARDCQASNPAKVIYCEHPGHVNLGMSASRNAGARKASGEFIALLDADDVWFPAKLESQLRILERHPTAAMLCGSSRYVYLGENGEIKKEEDVSVGVPGDTLYHPPELLCRLYPLGRGSAPPPSDLIIRQAAYEQVNGFEESFRGDLQLYEDQVFLTKIYLSFDVYVSSAVTEAYHVRPDSWMGRVKAAGKYEQVRLEYLRWLQRYLAGSSEKAPRVTRALRRALLPSEYPGLFSFLQRLNANRRSAEQVVRRAGRRVKRLVRSAMG